MTDPTTRRAEAIATLGGIEKARELMYRRRKELQLDAVRMSAVLDLAELALDAPADEGAAMRRLRSEMQDAWLACIENKKRFDVGSSDRRECQAEANAFQSACFAIDRELAELRAKDTPCTTSSDSSASSDSMTTESNPAHTVPTSPAVAADATAPSDSSVASGSTSSPDPAREPGADERAIAEWENLARFRPSPPPGTANFDGVYAAGYWIGCREVNDAVALMRRLLAERNAAVKRAEAAERIKDIARRSLERRFKAGRRELPSESEREKFLHEWTAIADQYMDAPRGSKMRDLIDNADAYFKHLAAENHTLRERIVTAAVEAAQPQPVAERELDEAVKRYDDVLSSLGLHPDTDHETVLAHIDSVRSEARESADAFSRGKAHGSAPLAELFRAAQPQPAATSERVQELRGDIMRDGGILYSRALDELCALASAPRAPEPAGDEQNRRLRDWFKARTGLDSDLLADHMGAIDELLDAARTQEKPEAAAAPAERDGDGVLWEFLRWASGHKEANELDIVDTTLCELCRRALEGRC